MKQKTFNQTTAIIFSIITLLHGLRLVLGWETVFGGWAVPLWASVVGILVAGYLAWNAFTLSR